MEEWLWIFGHSRDKFLPSLVLDGVSLPQTDLLRNLEVLLDFWLLVRKRVATVARKVFFHTF